MKILISNDFVNIYFKNDVILNIQSVSDGMSKFVDVTVWDSFENITSKFIPVEGINYKMLVQDVFDDLIPYLIKYSRSKEKEKGFDNYD